MPRRRSREELFAAPAKLVTTLLSVAAAGMVDAARFRRGREYATNEAVTEIEITQGRLSAAVYGSRREPYEVEVHTDVVALPTTAALDRHHLAAITPDVDELRVTCTCPDSGGTEACKHAAAVILAFAEEAGERPELLVAWRCGEPPPQPRATIGSRRDHNRTPVATTTPKVARSAPPSPFATPAWQQFFAFPADVEDARPCGTGPAGEMPTLGSEVVGQFDLSGMIRSAQSALRAAAEAT